MEQQDPSPRVGILSERLFTPHPVCVAKIGFRFPSEHFVEVGVTQEPSVGVGLLLWSKPRTISGAPLRGSPACLKPRPTAHIQGYEPQGSRALQGACPNRSRKNSTNTRTLADNCLGRW